MEEQKVVNKEIKMSPKKTEAEPQPAEKQKLSYEELNQACMDLSQQNQQMQKYIQKLHHQMQEVTNYLQTKRMDYLFKVVECQDNFKSDFVIKCCDEIQETLTIPEETEEEEKKGS